MPGKAFDRVPVPTRWILPGALLAACCGCFLNGCCAPPGPPAGKFFDRRTVAGTLKGFVYAVDTHQWGYAYESLTASTRNEVGKLKFTAVIRFLEAPDCDVALYDLISNALELRSAPQFAGSDEARILVISQGRDSNDTLVFVEVFLYFRLEEGEWRIDLLRSLGVASVEEAPVVEA
jgi:hypothetical protein